MALEKIAPGGSARLRRRQALIGYLWISPWLIGALLFTIGPMLASLFLSFTQYNIVESPRWIGLANYVQAFTKDDLFWGSMWRTLVYAAVTVTLGTTGSLGAALLLNRPWRGTALLRTAFFLPSLVPIVASALLWRWIFNPQVGLFNYLLSLVGIRGPAWFASTEWAMPGLIIMALWGTIGGSQMLIFLAGLQGVPRELYEAAEVDGAGVWGRFRHVTLPMISPTLFFNTILGLIGGLKVFSAAYVGTEGGPAYATWFYLLHLYFQAFRFFEMGYASALAWIFFAIVITLTIVQVRWSSRWVYYEGADGGGGRR
jgi:multiple sugar transport system permease protein